MVSCLDQNPYSKTIAQVTAVVQKDCWDKICLIQLGVLSLTLYSQCLLYKFGFGVFYWYLHLTVRSNGSLLLQNLSGQQPIDGGQSLSPSIVSRNNQINSRSHIVAIWNSNNSYSCPCCF